MSCDAGNGLFEFAGAVFAWVNAWKLYRDKQVRGTYWPTWAFFTAWGLWNLYYYPSLGQWFSFSAGILLVAGNAAWTAQAIYYRRLA